MLESHKSSLCWNARQSKLPIKLGWTQSDCIGFRYIADVVKINVLGLMNTHIAVAQQMVKQGSGGRIIGAGSISSYRTVGTSLYSVSTRPDRVRLDREPKSIRHD